MDSAHLHLQLLTCGERLFQALARQKEICLASRGKPGPARCQKRLGLEGHEVELAAERYAAALKSYRLATLAEFTPPARSPLQPVLPARCCVPVQAKRRGTANTSAGVCRERRSYPEEGFAVSTRLSKLQ
jgi:hypothetical protein